MIGASNMTAIGAIKAMRMAFAGKRNAANIMTARVGTASMAAALPELAAAIRAKI